MTNVGFLLYSTEGTVFEPAQLLPGERLHVHLLVELMPLEFTSVTYRSTIEQKLSATPRLSDARTSN